MSVVEGLNSVLGMLRPKRSDYERIQPTTDIQERDVDTVEQDLLERQYRLQPRPFPKREIVMGFVLLFLGCLLIFLGILDHLEHWQNHIPGSPTAFIGLGLLVFIPGLYASCIAIGAYLGWSGFSFNQMPRMQGL